ncbi:hypothetical protein C1646_772730 [Rhizophagus diaphanus]|nr:hypothetical protein C1646_772730 [Rhizophagus diaphanus] [Rhizophagus sp. MUCL 43196]
MDFSSEQETNIELPKNWLGLYSWLIYDASKNLMFCSLCKSYNKQNKFGKEDKSQQYIGTLMKIVFWLAENDVPLSKLSKVIQLCRALECPQLLLISNHITYENHVSGHEMLSAISNSIEETIWKELDEATAFGIMIDKSTDISCEPYLIIYDKDAKSIFELIIGLFDNKGLTNKLMSFASDGASVMLENLTGVALRIKERNKCLFIIHCIAHRLALACNSAEKQVPFCKHVELIMKSVYNFFYNHVFF